jgi:hypothetical protein
MSTDGGKQRSATVLGTIEVNFVSLEVVCEPLQLQQAPNGIEYGEWETSGMHPIPDACRYVQR